MRWRGVATVAIVALLVVTLLSVTESGTTRNGTAAHAATPRSQQYDRRIAEALEEQNKIEKDKLKALQATADALEDIARAMD